MSLSRGGMGCGYKVRIILLTMTIVAGMLVPDGCFARVANVNADIGDVASPTLAKARSTASAAADTAKVCAALKLTREAAKLYDQILQINPDDDSVLTAISKVWQNAGDCYMELGRRDDSKESYAKSLGFVERALIADPRDITPVT